MDSKADTTRAIPMPAAGWLSGLTGSIRRHLKVLGIIVILVGGSVFGYLWWTRQSAAGDYVTDKVSRGSIEVTVSATGTVQAVTTVQVGSQVSGTVTWLGADFKSQVTRGQIVAKLDPALFQAQVDTAQANLLNAQAGVQGAMTDINNQIANVEAAKANDRANAAARDDAQQLAKQNEQLKDVIPNRDIQASENAARVAVARYSQATSQIAQAQAQLEISKSKLKQAQAAVKQSQAQLEQATVNMQHSIITSPIDGVVVSRSVDVGQTVAASLSAPTLFTIANDLTSMQVLASIDEADVGQVKEGGKATFTVDAYSGQTFTGDITQLRLNAQTLQNVVTYTAVISVANPDQKLMPGMTANITIPVARRDNVLRVPNAALRFKPDLTDQQQKDLQAKMDAWRQQQRGQNGNDGATQPTETASPADGQSKPQDGSGRGGGKRSAPAASEASPQPDKSSSPGGNQAQSSGNQSGSGRQRQAAQVIWLLTANKTLEPHFVRTGLSDGRVTEIVTGDLKEGDLVVIGQTTGGNSNSNRAQPATPLGQRPPTTGGGRGGR